MAALNLIKELDRRNLLAKRIEVASWNGWSLVSCFSSIGSSFISESVSMGIDKNPDTALSKAAIEFCERSLAKTSNDPVAKLTLRSDGFAAFPVIGGARDQAVLKAAENSLNEAVERYAWATWWDNAETGYAFQNEEHRREFGALKRDFRVVSLKSVIIRTKYGREVLILLASNDLNGYITGGAASTPDNKEETFARAFGELLRHLIVVNRMKTGDRSNLSFYERRLWGFASGQWSHLVRNRLSVRRNTLLNLPALRANQEITHSHQDCIVVFRSLFENQPDFIGGSVERLCI